MCIFLAKNLWVSKFCSTFAVDFVETRFVARSRAVVARQAHNLKVGGSIPSSATKTPLVGFFNRRDGGVVDRGGLENRCTERYRGFESLSLRKTKEKARCKLACNLPFFFCLARMLTDRLGALGEIAASKAKSQSLSPFFIFQSFLLFSAIRSSTPPLFIGLRAGCTGRLPIDYRNITSILL